MNSAAAVAAEGRTGAATLAHCLVQAPLSVAGYGGLVAVAVVSTSL